MLNDVFENTIFFLGAGASKDVDCKTSPEMFDDLNICINSIEEANKKEVFNEIYNFIYGCLTYQQSISSEYSNYKNIKINIEDFVKALKQLINREFILPGPLVGNWNEKIIKWEIYKPQIFREFYEYILKQLIGSWTKYNEKKLKKFFTPFDELLTNTELRQVHIFTLNYDLVYEKHFNKNNAKILENGFEKGIWTGTFTEDDAHKETKINLYKLHGSLDWYYDSNHDSIITRETDNPLIIFGTENKMKSIDPFLLLLSKFREKLAGTNTKTKLVVVIGYSFFDNYLNNILIQQLNNSPKSKLLIVDPKFRGNIVKTDFLDELEAIQSKKNIEDIKNLSKLSPEKIECKGLTAKKFFKEYFSNDAKKMIEYYKEIDTESVLFQ